MKLKIITRTPLGVFESSFKEMAEADIATAVDWLESVEKLTHLTIMAEDGMKVILTPGVINQSVFIVETQP